MFDGLAADRASPARLVARAPAGRAAAAAAVSKLPSFFLLLFVLYNMRHESSALGILILILATSARHCSSFGPRSYERSHVPHTSSSRTRLLLNFNPFFRQSLQQECEERYPSSIWADGVTEGYEVAAKVFDIMLSNINRNVEDAQCIWLPNMKSREATQMLSGLIDVLNANTKRLGGWSASLETWPISPTTGIILSGVSRTDAPLPMRLNAEEHRGAIDATERWVNNTLGRLGLCPYTASMTRAAIGLDSVGVSSGPVVVRHTVPLSLTDGNCSDNGIAPTDAVILGASFWDAVMDLAHRPETEVATFLLVAPSSYDENFAEFISTCDNLLEGSCKAVRADGIIGKAWFHPNYNSSVVGQESIIPGHALPAEMVKAFVEKYFGDMDELDLAAVSRANDAVRHTPHATVNLLRRSQLRASKEAEAATLSSVSSKEGRQRRRAGPNSIYAQNVHTLHRLLSLEDDG